MPLNGSGVYSPPTLPVFPPSSGNVISSSYFTQIINDIASALSTTVMKDGTSVITADIPLNGYKLTNVGTPVNDGDAVNKNYVASGNAKNVRRYGAKGDYTTDDSAAFLAAKTAAKAAGVGVFIPNGNYKLNTAINFERVPFFGESETGTIIFTDNVTGSLFKITANATLTGNRYENLTFICGLAGGADYSSTAGIEVTGDNTGFFQFNAFENISFYGFQDQIKVSKGTIVTSFGNESTYSFNSHKNLTFQANTHLGKYGIRFIAGSGTGNVFENLRGQIGVGDATAAYLRYEGSVVGDITFANSQLGGGPVNGISIDTTCVYLSNITFPGTQFDAGCTIPILVGATAVPLQSLHLVGTNLGGLTTLAAGMTPMVAASVLHDLQASHWIAGNQFEDLRIGSLTRRLFSLTLDQWTGVSFKIIVSGLIGGVGGCVISNEYLAQRNTGTAVVQLVSSNYVNAAGLSTGGSTVTVSSSVAGNVITFAANYTSSSGSQLDAQIAAAAGTFKIARITTA